LVGRYIDDLRIGRHNFDDFLLYNDDLFFICFQIARGLSFVAKTLDGIHDIFLLIDHGVTQVLRPFKIFVHHFDDFRVVEEPQHTGVPILVGLEFRILFMFLQESRSRDDF
jgi:hypothetical protein